MIEIDFGVCVLADYDKDGHAQIQTDSPGVDGTEGTQPAEVLLPLGEHARPLDPDRGPNNEIGLGAPALVFTVGDHRYAIPLGDPRDVIEGRVPKLKKGGKLLTGGAGEHRSFIMIDGLDPAGAKEPGSVMIAASYTKGGAKKTLGLSFNVRDAGVEDISLVHGDGARVTLGTKGVTVSAPGGENYVDVSDEGSVLAGKAKVQGSLTVGDQTAAGEVALAQPLMLLLQKLITIVAGLPGGAPAAALSTDLALILAKHLKTS